MTESGLWAWKPTGPIILIGMSFTRLERLPTPEELIESLSLPEGLSQVKLNRDREVAKIFQGESDKFLLIIGPCSAHNEDAVCEYVSRLAKLQEEVKDKLVLLPRIYTNKPRTTGEGYKGIAHQPDPCSTPSIVEGMKAMRKMHIRALSESHLPPADEMLYPGNFPYLEDILGYVAVGARSVENQEHRLTVSGIDVPIGMKNPTSGDIEIMLNSVHAAQQSHHFTYNGWAVETSGNPLAHCILRGWVNPYGQSFPNYHFEDLLRLANGYSKRSLENRAVLVDTNHANSNKQYQRQPRIAMEVLESRRSESSLKKLVRGLMIESYLLEGRQNEPIEFGRSITDPCLGWKDSEKLVRNIAEKL